MIIVPPSLPFPPIPKSKPTRIKSQILVSSITHMEIITRHTLGTPAC